MFIYINDVIVKIDDINFTVINKKDTLIYSK